MRKYFDRTNPMLKVLFFVLCLVGNLSAARADSVDLEYFLHVIDFVGGTRSSSHDVSRKIPNDTLDLVTLFDKIFTLNSGTKDLKNT